MIRVGEGRAEEEGESLGTYHLFEVSKTEDGIVDLDLACGNIGHGYCSGWNGGEAVLRRDHWKSDLLRTVMDDDKRPRI